MNSAKFAAITSDLVVRKGEARPWPQRDCPTRSPQVAVSQDTEDPLEADEFVPPPHVAAVQDGAKRCTLRLSPCEYERLGIIAVKRDVTRQQILREAVETYLAAAERDYGRGCMCLSAGPGIHRDCTHGLDEKRRHPANSLPPIAEL